MRLNVELGLEKDGYKKEAPGYAKGEQHSPFHPPANPMVNLSGGGVVLLFCRCHFGFWLVLVFDAQQTFCFVCSQSTLSRFVFTPKIKIKGTGFCIISLRLAGVI
jgi:hypothetical protein